MYFSTLLNEYGNKQVSTISKLVFLISTAYPFWFDLIYFLLPTLLNGQSQCHHQWEYLFLALLLATLQLKNCVVVCMHVIDDLTSTDMGGWEGEGLKKLICQCLPSEEAGTN